MKWGLTSRRRHRIRRLLALSTGGIFLLFSIGQSPHLVHHLFDSGQNQVNCTFASRADHTPGLPSDPGTLISSPAPAVAGCVEVHANPHSVVLPPSDSRAPPRLAS